MDNLKDIGQQISALEEEFSTRMRTMHDRSPDSRKLTHSTPKSAARDLSDSGIIQTKAAGFDINTPGNEETPTLQGPFSAYHVPDLGARPKQPSRSSAMASGSKSKDTHGPSLSPIKENETLPTTGFKDEQRSRPYDHGKPRREIKLANYDGTSEWKDFKSHFEACALINKWDWQDKGLYLATALRGQAQSVFSDLPAEQRVNFDTLVNALEERFSPPNQTELYRAQLKERRQRASESLPELGQAIRRLVYKAYPQASSEVRETLAREHFIDALVDAEMRIRIKQARPENLNQTICVAVELQAFYKAEKKFESGRGHMHATSTTESEKDKIYAMMETFSAKLESLQKDLDILKNKTSPRFQNNQPSDRRKSIQCFNCGDYGHYRSECRIPAESKANGNGRQRNGAARPLRYRKRKQRSTTRNINLGTDTSSMEAGAYLDVKIKNLNAKFLVDTGATITMLSYMLFYSIPQKDRPPLEPVTQQIMSANGTELTIAGKGSFKLLIGTEEFNVDALVADVSVQGILGLDFMKNYDCHIDLQKDVLSCRNRQFPLQFAGKIGCYRASAAEDITIAPDTGTRTDCHEMQRGMKFAARLREKENRRNQYFRCDVKDCFYAATRKTECNRHKKRVHSIVKMNNVTNDSGTHNQANVPQISLKEKGENVKIRRTVGKPKRYAPGVTKRVQIRRQSKHRQGPKRREKGSCPITSMTGSESLGTVAFCGRMTWDKVINRGKMSNRSDCLTLSETSGI